ncbi:SLC13 family permease, partial [Acinetobacter baumannii]
METVQGGMLLVYTLIAIVALIVMIAKFRIYPFLVLIIVSLGLALAVGMPMDGIVKSYEAGTGKTLGHLAIVIALGTMLGKMMAESGGAERIAITLIKWFGEKHIHWAMMFIALIVGLPVFFEVGFVLLIPIAFNIAKRTGKSLLIVGLPMVAGLSVVHGLIPPHPAALLAVQAYHADIGKTIMYSLLVGVPTAVVAGPLYALWINKNMPRIYLTHFDACAQERFFMSNLTLSQFLQQEKGNLTPELAQVIDTIAATCKTIDQALQKGALAGILGSAGNENVQGETQKKLDVISNDYLIDALKVHPHVGGLASEELDDFTPAQENGEYLVLFDPLDGSSNIDINMCVGTIFSILPAKNAVTQAQDFMQA